METSKSLLGNFEKPMVAPKMTNGSFSRSRLHRSKAKGPFLTAMTAHSIQAEFYMTKFSFLTVFFSVCVIADKTPCLLPRGAIFNRFCAVYMLARKKRPVCFERLIYFP